MFAGLIEGFAVIFDPMTLLYIALGTIGGVIVGAMPGMSASMAVILAMTFSYALAPIPALAFLVAVYCAAITLSLIHISLGPTEEPMKAPATIWATVRAKFGI